MDSWENTTRLLTNLPSQVGKRFANRELLSVSQVHAQLLEANYFLFFLPLFFKKTFLRLRLVIAFLCFSPGIPFFVWVAEKKNRRRNIQLNDKNIFACPETHCRHELGRQIYPAFFFLPDLGEWITWGIFENKNLKKIKMYSFKVKWRALFGSLKYHQNQGGWLWCSG